MFCYQKPIIKYSGIILDHKVTQYMTLDISLQKTNTRQQALSFFNQTYELKWVTAPRNYGLFHIKYENKLFK